MNFTPGTQVYVRYQADIEQTFTELLTISKYENNLLFFEEKSSYYAVECNNAAFYGYSYTLPGSVMIVKEKWQLPFALLTEQLRISTLPARRSIKAQKHEPAFMKNFAG